MYLIKLLLPSPEREKLLSWPGKFPGSRKHRSACSRVHTARVFPDESSSGVLPLGKGQGELILWSVYTQCVLSLNALTRHLREALVKQQHQPLEHEDRPSSHGLQTSLKLEVKARCSRNCVKGRKAPIQSSALVTVPPVLVV